MSSEDKTGLTTLAALAAVILAGFALKAIAATALGFAAGLVVAGQSQWLSGLWDGLVRGLKSQIVTSKVGAGRPLADRPGYLGFKSLERQAKPKPLFTPPKWRGALSWKLIALVVVVIGLCVIASNFRLPFGESREHAIVRANTAERSLETTKVVTRIAFEEGQRFREATDTINENLTEGLEQIEAASHAETLDLLVAWRNADRSLCASAGGCRVSGT